MMLVLKIILIQLLNCQCVDVVLAKLYYIKEKENGANNAMGKLCGRMHVHWYGKK